MQDARHLFWIIVHRDGRYQTIPFKPWLNRGFIGFVLIFQLNQTNQSLEPLNRFCKLTEHERPVCGYNQTGLTMVLILAGSRTHLSLQTLEQTRFSVLEQKLNFVAPACPVRLRRYRLVTFQSYILRVLYFRSTINNQHV